MTREPLSIRKLSPNSGSYYLMQGQDKLAVIVPLSEHVYGPEIVGDLLTAMCELTNDAQQDETATVAGHPHPTPTFTCPECGDTGMSGREMSAHFCTPVE